MKNKKVWVTNLRSWNKEQDTSSDWIDGSRKLELMSVCSVCGEDMKYLTLPAIRQCKSCYTWYRRTYVDTYASESFWWLIFNSTMHEWFN